MKLSFFVLFIYFKFIAFVSSSVTSSHEKLLTFSSSSFLLLFEVIAQEFLVLTSRDFNKFTRRKVQDDKQINKVLFTSWDFSSRCGHSHFLKYKSSSKLRKFWFLIFYSFFYLKNKFFIKFNDKISTLTFNSHSWFFIFFLISFPLFN